MADNHKPKSPAVRYSLDNPHPLSQLRTELVWEPGKYTACLKVVDVFGCDTSITVEVKV